MPSVPNIRGGKTPDKDVCYLEAAVYDKDETADPSRTADNVWQAVKPPGRLGGAKPPMVSSRKLEIVRAQLNGKVKVHKEERTVSRETVKVSTTRISRRTKFS